MNDLIRPQYRSRQRRLSIARVLGAAWAVSVPVWGGILWLANSRTVMDDIRAGLFMLVAIFVGLAVAWACQVMED